MTPLPPLALYVHIPWCVRKCPYCDFNSHAVQDSHSTREMPQQQYVDALARDLASEMTFVGGRKLQSIFFGGGTPSLFSPDAIATIIDNARSQIGFADDIEITLEANPGTVEQQKFAGFRQAGVNRISVGIQSFDPAQLKTLGRIHDSAQALVAIDAVRNAGFDNFNIDLMHGLPDQTELQALADLKTALQFSPPHLSWYQLTIEPNTEFFRRPPILPEDDTLAAIQDAGEALLHQHGYDHYEVSAFAQPGREARHNVNYWQFGDYIGIGAGAHGKLTTRANAENKALTILRRCKTRLPTHYLARTNDFVAEQNVVEPDDLVLEFLINAFRLERGVDITVFELRTQLAREQLTARLQDLRLRGLVANDPSSLRLTDLGRRFMNDVLTSL
jgi:putative oxygen-independent coproporphyrinogen III oxidase